MPPTHGKNTPAPPSTSSSLQFATLFRALHGVSHCHWRRVMLDHSTGTIELHRISSETCWASFWNCYSPHPVRSRQDCKQRGMAIREFGSGCGCAFWLVKEPVSGGESPPPSNMQTILVRGRGADRQTMQTGARSGPRCWLGEHAPHVKSSMLS